VITHPEHARTLLIAHPQLAYALFQALLLNKIVDQGVLAVSLPLLDISAQPL
jgi:cleavage stimulation factor subunit 2